jgi:hypothetical protein
MKLLGLAMVTCVTGSAFLPGPGQLCHTGTQHPCADGLHCLGVCGGHGRHPIPGGPGVVRDLDSR